MSKEANNELIKCDNRNIDDIVNQEIERLGNNANLNHLDVSEVTDMTEVFYESAFNGDISKWDVSNVENMSLMFEESQFNGDISKWNVTKVKDTLDMFEGCLIEEENKPRFTDLKLKKSGSKDLGGEEKDLSRYMDVIRRALEKSKSIPTEPNKESEVLTKSKLKTLETIKCTDDNIKQIVKEQIELLGNEADLNHLDVSNVTDMNHMFYESQFNGDISNWNVSGVTDMRLMFRDSQFNGDISKWNVSNVENMYLMFEESQFNGDISKWNVSNVTDMSWMFQESQFNGNISSWDVSKVTDMSLMFEESQFNGNISSWDVSKVTSMYGMFRDSKFNGDISKWETKFNRKDMWAIKGLLDNLDIGKTIAWVVALMAIIGAAVVFNIWAALVLAVVIWLLAEASLRTGPTFDSYSGSSSGSSSNSYEDDRAAYNRDQYYQEQNRQRSQEFNNNLAKDFEKYQNELSKGYKKF